MFAAPNGNKREFEKDAVMCCNTHCCQSITKGREIQIIWMSFATFKVLFVSFDLSVPIGEL